MKTRILIALFMLIASMTFAAEFTVNFNSTSDLNYWFTDDGSPALSNISDGGINNTGCVDIPLGSNDVWTARYTFSVPQVGETAILSGYFLIASNGGYSGYGLSVADQNEAPEGACHVTANNLGVQFHGGGGAFFNNYTEYPLSWIDSDGDGDGTNDGDLKYNPPTWYFFEFSILGMESDQFFLELDSWLSNATGAIIDHHTHQEMTVTNAEVASASALYAYFSAGGSRSAAFDNYKVEATTITLPVTLSAFTATLTSTFDSVILNWEVESEHDHLGYNVLRSNDGNLDSAVKVNPYIIATDNETGGAASYNYEDYEIEQDNTYSYWLESIDLDGTVSMYGPATVIVTGETDEPGDTPEVTFTNGIENIYPNPFNPNTTVKFSLQETSEITVSVYNVRGSLVRTLEKGTLGEGSHTVSWDGTDNSGKKASSGIYFFKLETENFSTCRKALLMK